MSAKRAAVLEQTKRKDKWSGIAAVLLVRVGEWLTDSPRSLCAIEAASGNWQSIMRARANKLWQTLYLSKFSTAELVDPMFQSVQQHWKQCFRLRFITSDNWSRNACRGVNMQHRQQILSLVICPAFSVAVPSRLFIASKTEVRSCA